MKTWYSNVAVVITVIISLTGIATSSLLFLLIPEPSEVLALMRRRMTGMHSFRMETDVRWRGEGEAVEWSSAGVHEGATPEEPRMRETFSLTVGATDPLRFAGERVSIADARFVRFSALPDRIGTLHFSEFRDKWLRVEAQSLLRDVTLPLVGGGSSSLSKESRARLAEQFRRTPFLAIAERLASETLNATPTHHYKVVPEPLYLKDFYLSFERERLGRELTGKERLAADAFFADLSPEDGEIWVGKRDFLPHRARFRFRFDDGERRGTLDITVALSDFARVPAVEGPPSDDVRDVTPIIASLLEGARSHLPMAKEGSGNRVAAPEQGGLGALVVPDAPGDGDADEDGLTDALEHFYGTDRGNPDTDGDGTNDGDEVSRGDNPAGSGKLFDFTGGMF